jgi:hypothetical protein
MLLTAQRVVSPHSRAQGVNVYEYLHGPYHWERVPDDVLPERNPGELVAHWVAVPAGGNRVVSFLDIVCPDDLPLLELQQRVASLKHQLTLESNPAIAYLGPLWARFGCSNLPIPRATELAGLAGHILLCITGRRAQTGS